MIALRWQGGCDSRHMAEGKIVRTPRPAAGQPDGDSQPGEDTTVHTPATAADLYAARTLLGLTQQDLARHIDTTTDTIRQWEAGSRPIPDHAADAIQRLTAYTNGVVDALTQQATRNQHLNRDDIPDPAQILGRPVPEAWREAVMQRIVSRVTNT